MQDRSSRGKSQELSDIRKAILLLCDKFDAQQARIEQMELQMKSLGVVAKQQPAFIDSTPSPLAPPPPPPVAETKVPTDAEKPAQPSSNLEEKIGGNLFAKIGIVALFLGVSLFVKYAFDNNWIGPLSRVILGLLAGVVLLSWGGKTIRKYAAYGQIMIGGGLAILYLSLYAALNYYHLISSIPAFLGMIVVTAVGLFLSIRFEAPLILVEAILGGFATPFMVSSGQNAQVTLFSYVILLDLAVVWVSMDQKWQAVNLLGFVGTVVTFLSWFGEYYDRSQLFSTLLFLSLFFLLYSFSSVAYNLVRNQRSTAVQQCIAVFAAVFFFAESYVMLSAHHHAFLGFFAVMLALYYFLLAQMVKTITPEDALMRKLLTLLTIGLVTLAIPIQFDLNVITWGWMVEALVLLFLGIKTKQLLIERCSFGVYGLAVFHVLFFDSIMKLPDPTFMLNKRFATFLGVIVLSYAAAYLYGKTKQDRLSDDPTLLLQTKQLLAVLVIVANFLTIFSISQEIVGHYQRRITEIRKQQFQTDHSLLNPRYGNDTATQSKAEITKLQNKRDISLSLFWLVYSIVIVGAGFVFRNRSVRIGGMLLLLLAIGKLFFYDLWSLGTLYRITSSISLGVVLLSVSFAYQKYKEKLRDII